MEMDHGIVSHIFLFDHEKQVHKFFNIPTVDQAR